MKKLYIPMKVPVSLALVKMANGEKYLFSARTGQVAKGSRVLCRTRNGEQPGIVIAIVTVNDQEAVDFVMEVGRLERLEPIIAVMTPDYWSDAQTYWRGKGVEKPDEPVTITNVPTDAPYITVHLPSGDICTN